MTRRPPPEVFLSFRGRDSRTHFVKFLHMMFAGACIDAFMDEKDLPKGNDINDELIAAINQSMISIAVISKNYASSKSCLMELDEMLKCKDKKTIIPIFYYVKPSDVRRCRGPFARSFHGHIDFGMDATVIGSWMVALGQIGKMNGYHLHKNNEGDHHNLMKQIVRQVQQKLNKVDATVPEELVGVDPQVRVIMGKLDVDYRNGFRRKKILLLLDDVKDYEQLEQLVGKLDWLFPGSTVIVTSQTTDVLKKIDGAETYALDRMEENDALTLFCRHAFGADSPSKKFKRLSRQIVAATGRLPLALQLVGYSLYLVDSEEVWRETLTGLEAAPHKRVQAALEKSYTNLDKDEQQIFLDIACFFIRKDNRIPHYMWIDCKYSPSISILTLKARSLVEIGEDNELRMHEILKNFGREMVKRESKNEPCKLLKIASFDAY